MKIWMTTMGMVATIALLVGVPSTAAAAGKNKAATAPKKTAPAAAKPLHKMTKAEKIRAFFAMVREMGRVPRSCYFRGKKLRGKVKIVRSFPDFKVKRVSSFPDLKVKWVSSFPDKCGKWQRVSSFPDFKIQWVTSFPDFTIKIVSSFPGVP
jgi:hypothetical protein